ncbi:MAG TPA: carboxymuconolactone decarboxylase family protein [Chloroflexota bacterium]|nr:carboxymuconolactone decarboxylase family protein [Chloroflexota bacterium]
MSAYLQPIDKPRGLILKAVYYFSRRQFGKVATPIAVFAPRMPFGFLSLYGKLSKLDKKLELPSTTAMLIRERVSSLNTCLFCIDIGRWFAMKTSPEDLARMDSLSEYQTSPRFTEAERAALDYATELTQNKHVDPDTFARLRNYYSEREVCEIAYLVASEHLYNMTNIGLNIGSDGLCELRGPATAAAGSPVDTVASRVSH